MLDVSASPWVNNNYDPAVNSGVYGDRLTVATAVARLKKEVQDPGTGLFGSTTPSFTGGQTATFRLTPSLTAGVNSAVTVPTVVEDCLPVGTSFSSSTPAPSVVSATTPVGAGLTCGAGETYVKWDLGPQPINTAITPIVYSVAIGKTALAGAKINTAMVTAQGDSSAAALRTVQATIQIVQPAGIGVDKVALEPIVEVNRVGETTLDPLRWRVNFANIDTAPGPTDPDIIDVLPRQGVSGTSYHGTLVFKQATVIAGGAGVQVLYTKAAAPVVDPNDPTNNATTGSTVWCDAPAGGTVVLGLGTAGDCPTSAAQVTGLRVRRAGAFGPSDVIAFEVEMTPTANVAGDLYVNQTAGRATGLALMVGPASAPITIVSSTIGDKVFRDLNFNGLQDVGEPGIDGFKVTLSGTDSDGNTVGPLTTTTAGGGLYQFSGLQSGNYTVTFAPTSLAANERFTFQAVGFDSTIDSDGDPATGVANVTLGANFNDPTIDQGVVNATPAITIVKRINGDDANTAPGVQVPLGSTMNVTYDITNSGTVTLSPVTLTDNVINTAAIVCPKTALTPGESMQCTATAPAPAPGVQHTNTGTVVGTPVQLPDGTRLANVTANDPANAFVSATPAIHLVKYVVPNGDVASRDDANVAPGIEILVGGTASWMYEVTNPGNTPLTNVTVKDDNGTATTSDDWTAAGLIVGGFNAGDVNSNGLLDTGETWIFVAPVARTLTVTAGQVYSNIGTATGTPNYPGPRRSTTPARRTSAPSPRPSPSSSGCRPCSMPTCRPARSWPPATR